MSIVANSIIHNESFKLKMVQLQCKCSLVSPCSSSYFSTAQQTRFSTFLASWPRWGFFVPYTQFLIFLLFTIRKKDHVLAIKFAESCRAGGKWAYEE